MTGPVTAALDASLRLLATARREGVPCFGASLLEGPAVLLGQHQRAARVVDVERCRAGGIPVFRRATSGTAAFVGRRALLFSLALPHVGALFADASPRTLLNRNVRPFLRGLSAAGAMAHYFGREWVSARKRPAMLVGFDATEDGAVLVEAIAGIEEAFALPDEIASEDERAVDRFTGNAPAGLAEVLPAGTTPEKVAQCVADAVGARASGPVIVRLEGPLARVGDAHAGDAHTGGDAGRFSVDLGSADPVPEGATLLAPARVPIGWLERARMPDNGGLWLGGDVLAPRWVLDRLAAAASGQAVDLGDGPLEGVSAEELAAKARG